MAVNQPTIIGFTAFLRGVADIPVAVLPDDSPTISDAFTGSQMTVSPRFCALPGGAYATMVYNLATDYVINYATDQPNQTFFRDLRKTFGLGLFVPGVISSSSDQGTSNSRVTPEVMKNLTFADLQTLKTPFGRAYLGMAQTQGTLWGIS